LGELSSADLTGAGWLGMKFNIADIYRQVLMALNYDPNRVIAAAQDTALPWMFK